ncbi:MAG: fibronectin type III domain-containing protein, partial [Candidatus Micrarchaeota archaeon]
MLKFGIFIALILILIQNSSAINLECSFEPLAYSGVTNSLIQLSLKITSDLPAQTQFVSLADCGNGDLVQLQNTHSQESQIAISNFSCVYETPGNYMANATVVYLGAEYSCAKSNVGITQNPVTDGIIAQDILLDANILAGSNAVIKFNLKNIGNLDVNSVNARVFDATESKTLFLSEGNAIEAGGKKSFEFQWDTYSATIGSHVLIFSAHFGDNSYETAKTLQIRIIPAIASVNAVLETTSAIISWSEEPEGNYTITYWKNDGENFTIANSTFSAKHRQVLGLLEPNTNYRHEILACNLVGCAIHAGSFTTIAQPPVVSAAVSPTSIATITSTPKPTISPSPTPRTTVRPPDPVATFSPTPVINKIEIVSEEIGEIDIEELNKILDNETVKQIVDAKDKAIFNRIQVIRNQTDPEDFVREGFKLRLIATTDSKSALLTPKCYLAPQD